MYARIFTSASSCLNIINETVCQASECTHEKKTRANTAHTLPTQRKRTRGFAQYANLYQKWSKWSPWVWGSANLLLLSPLYPLYSYIRCSDDALYYEQDFVMGTSRPCWLIFISIRSSIFLVASIPYFPSSIFILHLTTIFYQYL